MMSRRQVALALAGGALGASRFGTARARTSPATGVAIKNARDVRNGWGVNVPSDVESASATAAALGFIGTRWVRMQFAGDTSTAFAALQHALVRQGASHPDLKLQLVLNDYIEAAAQNTWAAQQRWILERVLPIRTPSGGAVLAAIEGPNEVNSGNGGGARGPDDAIDKTGGQLATADNLVANRNFVDWAQRLGAFRRAHAQALRGVEILSPTILYYYPADWSKVLDVSRDVDFATFHYYAGPRRTGGVPSWPANPDNFARMYRFAQAGLSPGRPLVQSEGGFASQVAGGYAADGRSGARYQLMQILDHHAVGGHRYMIYDLFNGPASTKGHVTADAEENFGQFYGDRTTPKPAAIALRNLSNLLSLGNDFADPRNGADTRAFAPAFDPAGLSVEGLRDAGSAGHALVMPKSDGSIMIAVWNEPVIDTGSGVSATPAPNPITVRFGSAQDYAVYDPTGGGGAADFVVRATTTPIREGSGQSVDLTLTGTPLLIELKARSGR